MSDEYGKHATAQRQWGSVVLEYLEKHKEILAEIASKEEPFSIMDLGCADGVNSIPILSTLVNQVREHKKDKKISIYLDDTLDSIIKKATDKVKSGLGAESGIEIHGIAKTFYSELLEKPTIDLAYCITAIHWLSKVPGPFDMLTYVSTEEIRKENKVWEDQAENDIRTFLECRAKEIKIGGHLIISTLGAHDKLTPDEMKCTNLHRALSIGVVAALKAVGLEKYMNLVKTLPIYMGQESLLIKRYSGSPYFKLMHFELHEFPYPPGLWSKDMTEENVEKIKGFTKGWTYGFFKSSLECAGVIAEKVKEFMDNYYDVQIPECYKIAREAKDGIHVKTSIYVAHLQRI